MISTNDVVGRYTVVGCVFGFHDIAFSWRWAIGETFDSGGGVFGSFSFGAHGVDVVGCFGGFGGKALPRFLFMRASPDWGNIAHHGSEPQSPTRPLLRTLL